MSLRGRKVLVTGADGFIGSHLAERLVELGADVRAMVFESGDGAGWLENSDKRREMEIVAADVTDAEACEAAVAGREIIYHLAACASVPDGDRIRTVLMKTNVFGTLAMLDASLRNGIERFIQASSAQTYDAMGPEPIGESHPLRARSAYAASKIAADSLVDVFHFRDGLATVTLKLFSVFGPRQAARNLVPTILSQLFRGPRVELGNLAPRRDYVYVDDTVDAFLRAAVAPDVSGMVFNIGGCTDIDVESLAKLIAALAGQEIEIVSNRRRLRPRSQDVDRLVADGYNSAHILGWKPLIDLHGGLRRTIEWYRASIATGGNYAGGRGRTAGRL